MKHVVLLHGATGSKSQLEPLEKILKDDYSIHLFNLPGHGGLMLPAEGFSIAYFADYVLQYLDNHAIDRISFFGYSMGGYVAMYFAKKYPHRVEKVITLATKFYWDEATAAKEISLLQPDKIQEKIPAFAAELQSRHSPVDWKEQLIYIHRLLENLGKQNTLSLNDYEGIQIPALIMLGDRDRMVTLAETVDVFDHLPMAFLAVLPQTPHPIEKADLELLKVHIHRFLEGIK